MFSLTRTVSRWRSLGVLAGLLTVMTTNVAVAHGGSPPAGRAGQCTVVRNHGLARSAPARRQYRRGYNAGKQAGFAAGYDAAQCGSRYDPSPKITLTRRTRHYRAGYARGFAEAYAQGYHQDRLTHRRSWRFSWRW